MNEDFIPLEEYDGDIIRIDRLNDLDDVMNVYHNWEE